ncbi:uncharacterized protein STEHIDRAFT_124650 [Stereum hirsutum FP-91666 SS1]|uniref:uncharacterized protein n=1 Tax=Stereum hirsutum (strain FP-91666) TaxID=721885 RepID=UPI000444A4BF|nr:uncharacterized protein STEHIDRAFT_124650 [Stereum hirsutum FP-91666 SS1]EIM82578.1 hypothetical protein STEHIDRAFT_124650 [Stereum hirsutum FP-91666 SS1]
MHTISNFYLRLDAPYPLPLFSKPQFPPPTDEDMKEYLDQMPHLKRTYPVAELGSRYAEMNRGVVRVDVCVPGYKLRQMQRKANELLVGNRAPEGNSKGGSTDDRVKLSRQDVLTAWIVMALNKVLESPIETLTNAASYRNLNVPFADANLAGNEIYIAKCPPWPAQLSNNLCGLALTIHNSISESRKAENLRRWMSVASHAMLEASNTDHSMFFEVVPGMMTVNSQLS